jgi:hypothetical protein
VRDDVPRLVCGWRVGVHIVVADTVAGHAFGTATLVYDKNLLGRLCCCIKLKRSLLLTSTTLSFVATLGLFACTLASLASGAVISSGLGAPFPGLRCVWLVLCPKWIWVVGGVVGGNGGG